MRRSIQDMVRSDLIDREQLGIQRYGTALYAYNGRAALVDAYEEALDLACYLRQAIEEQGIHLVGQPPPTLPPTAEEPHHAAARSHAADECGYFCTHAAPEKDPAE